jgi:hypothetical protein
MLINPDSGPAASLHRPRHAGDDITFEPGSSLGLRQGIDRGGTDAGIDGAAREDERARHGGIPIRFHERRGGKRRYRRLAHRKHVQILLEVAKDGDQGVDIVVEVEATRR